MLSRHICWLAVMGIACVIGKAVGVEVIPPSFPLTVKFDSVRASCSQGTCETSVPDSTPQMPDSTPQMSMLQKQFKTVGAREHLGVSGDPVEDEEAAAKRNWYRWGVSPLSEHSPSIGKSHPHPSVQHYEAMLPYLEGMVLNIFAKVSNGDGGLLLALEVPSVCGTTDTWVEVDRSRCSSRYPCALRLPGSAVMGSEAEPTKFRTRVISEDEDYLTNLLEYERVTLDHDALVKVGYSKFRDGSVAKRTLKFNLDAVLASGALSVTPVVQGATHDTAVTMRFRQPSPGKKEKSSRKQAALAQSTSGDILEQDSEMSILQNTLQSYRAPWAAQWRSPSTSIEGCDFSEFEVVADQLYPGDVELEVWTTGGGNATISDVLVTTRVSWAEAEVSLLDAVMKDHFAYFTDPDVIIHGLPVNAIKKEKVRALTDSNPTEWGYAMESWIIMAETGVLEPEDVLVKLNDTFRTLDAIQLDPDQFVHGMFYPYYHLRSKFGEKVTPRRTDLKDLPCGDDALLYASMMMVMGWLKTNKFHTEASTCGKILSRMHFKHCVRKSDCSGAGNGLEEAGEHVQGDRFWSVPLTINAENKEPHNMNWNVWADEGGIVAMIVALTGAVNDTQYESIVRQQQRYSPCTSWEGVTVGHSAFFNSIFTLPTRSLLGFGTLFSSPYYHEFTVRTILPSFRAHQKLKKKLGVDYIGPSDAMTMMPKAHPGKFFGSYAYWPPNNLYDCRQGKTIQENQCTWCKGIQYEGLEDPFDTIVPHGNMAAFLVASVMEKSQFTRWLEDTKLLMTDWSEVYTPGYGLEVVAPAKRTPLGGKFEGAYDGRGVWETLSHGYTVISMYEGLATMRRRFDLVKKAGMNVPGAYEPPKYKPLSDFVDVLPEVRSKIDKLLAIAREQESTEKTCPPSDYGPPGHY